MKPSLLAFVILALCSGACRSDETSTSGSSSSVLSRIKNGARCRRFDADLDSQQEVPKLDIQKFPGKCKGLLRLNKKKDTLRYKIGCFEQLRRTPFAGHIHKGAVGENGGVEVALEVNGERIGRIATGIIQASVIGEDKFEELVGLFFAGKAYFNIHTAKSPSGEVRGQIVPPVGCLEEEEPEGDEKLGTTTVATEAPATTDAPEDNICDLPKIVGPCEALFQRYWYNNASGKCEKFFYGGCFGNANNFDEPSLCASKCGGEVPDEEHEEVEGYGYRY